jgi:purine nucleosidase/pyrimidine-specific ribonucleoside hydrolase
MSQTRTTQIDFLERRYGMKQITEVIEPPPGDPDAASFMIEKVLANPGEITLVTIGPLTNVATAMQISSEFCMAIQRVVMMGGTAACPGNISPAAEFNYWQDPEAADIVFRSGVPLTMVGLDVCHKTQLLPTQVEECAAQGSTLGQFVLEATRPWFKAMAGSNGQGALHLYDSLAMAVAVDPSLVTLEDSYVEIETGDGPAQGMSVSHHKPFQRWIFRHPETNAKVALDVDTDRFNQIFQARVLDRIK